MRKHRTAKQDTILLKFMERHPDIARGNIRGDRSASATAWTELTKELNANGPPCKTREEWRRIWKDWKQSLKKKIVQDKKAVRAVRRFSRQSQLTPAEDRIALFLNLYETIEGVEETQTCSLANALDNDTNKESEEDSKDAFEIPIPKNMEDPLASSSLFLDTEETATLKEISGQLQDINSSIKSNTDALLALTAQIKAFIEQQQRNLEK